MLVDYTVSSIYIWTLTQDLFFTCLLKNIPVIAI